MTRYTKAQIGQTNIRNGHRVPPNKGRRSLHHHGLRNVHPRKAIAMTPPTPEQIRAARQSAHLTQTQAAELIYKQRLAWARYESGDREMDPALWELFQIKTKQSPE